MTARATALRAFIEAAEGQPVIWGESDCSAWATQWVRQITGRAPQLPVYASRDEASALIAAAGGLDRLWNAALAPIGIFPTEAPALGDVAVVEMRRFGQIGLVIAEGGIGYWRAETGVQGFAPRTIVRAWAVP